MIAGVRRNITKDMRKVLERLRDGAEVSSRELGRSVYPTEAGHFDKSELGARGAALAGHLRQRGYVQFLPDLRAWRITQDGRDFLKHL